MKRISLIVLAVALTIAIGLVVGLSVDIPEPVVWPNVCQEMANTDDPAATPVVLCWPATATPWPTWGAETRAAVDAFYETRDAETQP